MAIINSLAIGKAVNSAGNLTFQTVKGRTIAREKPTHVANPNTPAQAAQRDKMRNLVEAWRTFFFQARLFFTVIPGYGSAYNQFVKMNMPYASSPWVTEGVFTNLPANSYVSNGKYGTGALLVETNTVLIKDVSIADAQLRTEIVEGDIFAAFAANPSSPFDINLTLHELTAPNVVTLAAGDPIEITLPYADATFAIVYYSPSRSESSTGRWTAV